MDSFPDEVLLQCLARVPPAECGPGSILLRGVCLRWRELVTSEAFQTLRKELSLCRDWLVTLTWRLEGGLLCKVYDPSTNRCQRLPCSFEDLEPSRRSYGITAVDRVIFIMGGEARTDDDSSETFHFFNTLSSYDPALDRHRKLRPMATPRSLFACCSGGGKIYVMGGTSAEGVLAAGEMYDIASDTWEPIPDLPQARTGGVSEYVKGKVYVLGGSARFPNGCIRPVDTMDVFDVQARKWGTASPLPFPRRQFQTTRLHGRLCVVGGTTTGGNGMEMLNVCFNAPLVYDDAEDTWKVWKLVPGYPALRPLGGAEGRVHCEHGACEGFQSRPYAVAALNDELHLVRRCDNGQNGYCRHIHRFRPEMANAGMGAAWTCLLRKTRYSSLLWEAGDCWEHSVAVAVKY